MLDGLPLQIEEIDESISLTQSVEANAGPSQQRRVQEALVLDFEPAVSVSENVLKAISLCSWPSAARGKEGQRLLKSNHAALATDRRDTVAGCPGPSSVRQSTLRLTALAQFNHGNGASHWSKRGAFPLASQTSRTVHAAMRCTTGEVK